MFRLQIDFSLRKDLSFMYGGLAEHIYLSRVSARLHSNVVTCIHTWEQPGLIQLCEMTVMS